MHHPIWSSKSERRRNGLLLFFVQTLHNRTLVSSAVDLKIALGKKLLSNLIWCYLGICISGRSLVIGLLVYKALTVPKSHVKRPSSWGKSQPSVHFSSSLECNYRHVQFNRSLLLEKAIFIP